MKTNPPAKPYRRRFPHGEKSHFTNKHRGNDRRADAVRQRMFETSNGTMDVAEFTIKTGPYAGCQATTWMARMFARTHGIRRSETKRSPGN